jgi:hypothetical protein
VRYCPGAEHAARAVDAYPFAAFSIPCARDSALEVVPFSARIRAWAFYILGDLRVGRGVRADVRWVKGSWSQGCT